MTLARRLFYLLLIFALLGGAIWWLTRPQPVAVVVHEVGRGKVEASIANTRAGEVEACQRTKMSTIIGGRIEDLPVREGDHVKAGQVLMRLWNRDIDARLSVNRTQLITAGRRVQEACALADNAEREAERQAALVKRGFVSASVEDKARTEARARRSACATARADVATVEAQMAATEIDRQRTVLTAPFDGTVAKITGELGEYATPSPPGVPTPPAIDLIDESCLYVKAPMDEIDAPKIQPGQVVRISFEALPDRVFAGRVKRIAPYITAVEKQARTVEVDVAFDHPEEARGLLVGYSADVEIVLDTREDTLRIPTAALREGQRVLVLGDDGVLSERALKTGLANWDQTEVLEGLAAGERIVTSLEREGVTAGAQAVVDDDGRTR
ncbi:efflux transporter periplasmic adaptor subunit [Parazoarcus communis]|uniref:Efflux transporter periplasmic adaptor subunit n=1 Tax=Parazoarcus communis TaxID=41977 RepID=A0A2U8GX30_9RHOO|nr:efflux RND transporter periplasmic adaptor subunit [Parazoarcus communis]AWI76995.1 efflux transporter periplasmic adaptor subunit [Parazoarcus communis]|tara:strand:+ start:17477 stop:18631 length:1155 start_codon:yes stop_codon:yes gene_type:complete